MDGRGYSLRTYRTRESGVETSFRAVVKETDLLIRVDTESYRPGLKDEVEEVVFRYRQQLDEYIRRDSEFRLSLTPYLVPGDAPAIVLKMAKAGNLAGVGPMAAVAGLFAELAGSHLIKSCGEVMVENGGDVYVRSNKIRRIAILAGESPFSGRLALELPLREGPLGVCTSSGSVGPSLSLGRADAAVILATDTPLADAVATATANKVQEKGHVRAAAEFACTIGGVLGALVIKGDVLAAQGEIKLLNL